MKSAIFMRSERLVYRLTMVRDVEMVLTLENDRENISYIIPWSRDEHITTLNDSDKRHIVIEDEELNQVGYIILAGLENPHQNIELVRIVISKKNKGYGREAIRALLQHVFGELGAHRIWLDVKVHNERARQLYLSLGFKQEGILRECIKNGDHYESLILMSLLRQEFTTP
ncbi:GNAT family N-acetyltransferase [Paenibacillus lentus]|uniref:N-acetyltransferase n=1 Tax=Paenibacillus lentus TaxID=1338368 RepID=A0A3Q8S3I1_9BACL|nr:GNAT family protein [Paenibacillus lentus]AZK45117.1 N-acetyltransferase [Paenibacillus lentus]